MTRQVAAVSSRWVRPLEEHRAAVEKLVGVLDAVPESRWLEPWEPGKWSPSQIAEHLALSYEAVLRELSGEAGMQLKLSPARRRLLRWFLLPHMLFHRSFPAGARSPREVRPPDLGAVQGEIGERIRELASRFEAAITRAGAAGEAGITHPYFGRIPPLRALRFITLHLEHHRKQIPVSGVSDL
jgi:hypothetical protein